MTRCLIHSERKAMLEAERIQREREEYEASLPWIFRISARFETWALIGFLEIVSLAMLAKIVGLV